MTAGNFHQAVRFPGLPGNLAEIPVHASNAQSSGGRLRRRVREWAGQMDRPLPWQRQLYECERLICQRDTDLSEVRGLGDICFHVHLPISCPESGEGGLPGSNPGISTQPRKVTGFHGGHKHNSAGSSKPYGSAAKLGNASQIPRWPRDSVVQVHPFLPASGPRFSLTPTLPQP